MYLAHMLFQLQQSNVSSIRQYVKSFLDKLIPRVMVKEEYFLTFDFPQENTSKNKLIFSYSTHTCMKYVYYTLIQSINAFNKHFYINNKKLTPLCAIRQHNWCQLFYENIKQYLDPLML